MIPYWAPEQLLSQTTLEEKSPHWTIQPITLAFLWLHLPTWTYLFQIFYVCLCVIVFHNLIFILLPRMYKMTKNDNIQLLEWLNKLIRQIAPNYVYNITLDACCHSFYCFQMKKWLSVSSSGSMNLRPQSTSVFLCVLLIAPPGLIYLATDILKHSKAERGNCSQDVK